MSPSFAPETRYTKNANGDAIAYQTLGDASNDIVYMGSFGCIDLIWDDPDYAHFLHRLAGMGRLIMFDARGIGASDHYPPGRLPTPEKWLDDLRVVLDAAGSTEASIVAAAHYGVMAMFFAATYPERAKALVLVDACARWQRAPNYPIGGAPEGVEFIVQIFEQTWGKGISTAMSTPSRRHDPRFVEWLARVERQTCSQAEIVAYWRWGLDLDVRDVLPVIRTPTLVVHNNASNIVTLEHAKYLCDHIEGSRLVQIDGRDSFVFQRAQGDHFLDHIEEFLTGAPPAPRGAEALATVLFTDIVSSTEHAVRLGDQAWSDLIERHDQILIHELSRHQGEKVAPTGDGLLATFDGPERAIRCAVAIRGAVRELGLEVRAGLHTGEVMRRSDNIHGIAVHIGARVAALAGPNEVLVSSTVKDLVVGSDVRFIDRGSHQLKGVPSAWRVFAVA